MARSTLPDLLDDRFPEHPEGIDKILKDIVKAMVDSWTCETHIADLQAELLLTRASDDAIANR